MLKFELLYQHTLEYITRFAFFLDIITGTEIFSLLVMLSGTLIGGAVCYIAWYEQIMEDLKVY